MSIPSIAILGLINSLSFSTSFIFPDRENVKIHLFKAPHTKQLANVFYYKKVISVCVSEHLYLRTTRFRKMYVICFSYYEDGKAH